MHKQLKHTTKLSRKENVLLFVFFSSVVLLGISLYNVLMHPNRFSGQLQGFQQAPVRVINTVNWWAWPLILFGLFLVAGIFVLLIKELQNRKNIINEFNTQKDFHQSTAENESKIKESEKFTRGILDTLDSSITVISASGTIVKANRAWNKFLVDNHVSEKNQEGSNYFTICKNFGNTKDATGTKALEGIKKVFDGSLDEFYLEYSFNPTAGDQWFSMRAIKFESNEPLVVIEHNDISLRKKEEEKRIAKTIADVQERERRYIGQELHDNVNQILAGSLLTIAMVKQKQTSPERVTELIDLCEEYLVHAIDEVRKLSHKLASAFFEQTTLKNIFQDLLLKSNLGNRFVISFKFDEVINAIASEDIQINLYRILQEQIKNILKYSDASAIEVSVSLSESAVQMRTFDNGNGFDPETVTRGIGLSNITKRVDSLAGKFILNSAPMRGCEMIIEIPLENMQ